MPRVVMVDDNDRFVYKTTKVKAEALVAQGRAKRLPSGRTYRLVFSRPRKPKDPFDQSSGELKSRFPRR